jgi:hypothetical protein
LLVRVLLEPITIITRLHRWFLTVVHDADDDVLARSARSLLLVSVMLVVVVMVVVVMDGVTQPTSMENKQSTHTRTRTSMDEGGRKRK